MKMHWDGRKCFLRFIRGTTQLDRHDAYPLCAGARTCFLDNGRTRLSLPAPPDLRPFRPHRFGKARSGVICHQAVLTGLTPSPARFPRLVLRRPHPCAFPFIIAAFSPFCKGDLQIFQGRRQRLFLWTPAGLCPAPAKGLRPSRHPFAIELSFLSYCFRVFMRGFRLCGGDQRALRSPSGLLRPPSGSYRVGIATFLVSAPFGLQTMHKPTANNPKSSGAEGFQRAIGKPFGAPAGASPCGTNHRGIIHLLAAAVCSGYMRFRSFRMHEK